MLARLGTYGVLPVLLSIVAGCEDVRIPDPAVRYLAFGDSTTRGPSDLNYPDVLPELLGEEPAAFGNEGSGGETAAEGVERLRFLLEGGFFPNAHTLLYWQGGIDLMDFIGRTDPLVALSPGNADYPFRPALTAELDRIQADIEAALAQARGAGLSVYAATYFWPPETLTACDRLFLDFMLPGQARNVRGYVQLLNDRIRRAAANQGAVLVDVAEIAPLLAADPANFRNCNHLSEKGNRRVAEVFAESLRPAE